MSKEDIKKELLEQADDIDKIHGYAGEKFEHVTYEDMVKTIDALL